MQKKIVIEVDIDAETRPLGEIISWADDNVRFKKSELPAFTFMLPGFYAKTVRFTFYNEDDALLFKMRCG